jgi:type IV pilus assembly protein PilY1
MQQVDPFLLAAWPETEPVVGPFSVVWIGTLLVPADGLYHFRLEADDGVRFWLDGEVVDESMVQDAANSIQPSLELTAGPHTVRIDYFQRGGGKAMEFFWQPPDQPLQPVAPQYLQPNTE